MSWSSYPLATTITEQLGLNSEMKYAWTSWSRGYKTLKPTSTTYLYLFLLFFVSLKGFQLLCCWGKWLQTSFYHLCQGLETNLFRFIRRVWGNTLQKPESDDLEAVLHPYPDVSIRQNAIKYSFFTHQRCLNQYDIKMSH